MEVHVHGVGWVHAEVSGTFEVTAVIDSSGFVELCPVSGNWHNSFTEVEGQFTNSILESIGKLVLQLFQLWGSGISKFLVELTVIFSHVLDFGGINFNFNISEVVGSNGSSQEG